VQQVKATRAYINQQQLSTADANIITCSRMLAYADTTWKRHASAIRSLKEFCVDKNVNLFSLNESLLSLFLLDELYKGTTVSSIKAKVDAYSFITKFFGMQNFVEDRAVHDVLKFVDKVAKRNSNKKAPFGEKEIEDTFEVYVKKYGPFQNWPILQRRTFMLAVFQTVTFCRYSEAQNVMIEDVVYDVDYIKILIKKSKTDQAAIGEYVYIPKVVNTRVDAHMLLCQYIHKTDFNNGSGSVYLFPSLKWDRKQKSYVPDLKKQVSYNVALKNFKMLLKQAGFDEKKYGMHSPRIGATTDAFFQQIPEHIIDQRGRWKSKNSKYNYLRLNEKHFIEHLKNV
jgi:integrase